MKVIFHEFYYPVYTSDPASASGRLEAVIASLPEYVEMVIPQPATEDQLRLAHTEEHIREIRELGLYDVAALAAGGALESARTGLSEPSFGVIRPPGHHASADSAWGFCFFNNMAVALLALKQEKLIETALVLDIDLHYGDGTENILGGKDWISIHNIAKNTRREYIDEIEKILSRGHADIIGISAGFDNHASDWGGLMATDDYREIGEMVRRTAADSGAGCFGILEGGYNHNVLGKNVAAMIDGLSGR